MNVKHALAIVLVMSTVYYAVMGYAGYDPSIEAETLMGVALLIMFAWWAWDDAKKQKFHRPYEFGAFIYFAWPIVLPVYLIATRGWKGLLIFPVFVAIYYLPWASGWVAYYLNSANQ